MKIMSWNSRGSAWDGFEAQTLFYVTCFNVDVLCILDTRSSTTMLNKTRKLPFDESFVVPSIGQSGGLNLLWNSKSVSVNIIALHDRFIHCHITDAVSNVNFLVTFLYAYPKKEKQLALWNDITKLCPTDNSSWVIIGDFNITMSPEEKLGGIGGVTRPMLNFCEFLNNSGLVSLKASGLPFTWTNKHVDDSVIFERLDRAVVNSNFLNMFPNAILENLPIISSDHGPIYLNLSPPKKRVPRPFKFEAIWFSHPSFSSLVDRVWNKNLETNPLLNFVTIAGQFAQVVKTWNKTEFGSLFKRMEDLNRDSADIQQQLMDNPTSNYLKQRDTQIRAELLGVWKQEEIFWAQKAKANWLKLGDRNTKFFQAQANIRRKMNHIAKLQDREGNWTTNEDEITNILVQDFKKRFHQAAPPNANSICDFISVLEPTINQTDNELLLQQVTDEEIYDAVHSIGALKAPGPDGLHAIFFQKCWDEVKNTLIPMVKTCFNNGNLIRHLNHTNIALIPKIENPSKVNDFRPISLCNVAYKIITKIMIKRLKPLLEKCISKNQGAFAPGRAIQDNILIAHEIFSDFHRRTGRNSAMAVKLDLEKAYDLLDWSYIQACLCKFGFHSDWINLIMHCISSVSFSIMLNGIPKGWFQPTRGIRQGDPLSPYIFILAMEPLIRNLNLLASNSKYHVGLLTSPLGFRISNLMFADDCLIFAKASKKAARKISQVLDAFSAASGQKINFHKSSLFFSDKVNSSTKNEIVNVINIQHKRTIGKYLGIHNVVFWKDPTNAKELLQRISSKLSGWKQNTLSRAGKTTLIKANISGMPNHVMSCFKCPKKLTDEIDKQSRNFLWGTEMKTAPIAWKEVCKPKVLGGLGIRPSAFFNKAAIAKLAWKVITDKENWWVQVITRKYLKHGSLFQAKKKPKNSMAWNGILDAKDLIFKGLRWVVGNGKSINFWTFNWVLEFPLIDLIPEQNRNNVNIDECVCDYIIDGKWNRAKLSSILENEVVKEIMGIPIPVNHSEDEFIWGPSPHGKFTIKSATWMQLQDTQEHGRIKLIKKLWSLNIQPKIKFFGWLLLRGRLKTRDRLSRFGITQDNSCCLCNEDNETIDHLFGYCRFTRKIWETMNMCPPIDWDEGFFKVLHNWFLENPFDAKLFEKLIITCWQVWKTRNEVIFRGKTPNTRATTIAVTCHLQSASDLMEKKNPSLYGNEMNIKWNPPSHGRIKINFDGSVQGNSAAGGFILRTENGNSLTAASFYSGTTTVPVAEAMALRNSLICAKSRGITKIEVEGDSKLVIDAVNGVSTPPWRLLKLIQDIKTLSNSFEFVCFKHVFREANFVANALANLGHRLSNLCFWEEIFRQKHLLLWPLTL
ncbi:hypothetical protein ACLB2K_036592 [Fragaria x ananassa]